MPYLPPSKESLQEFIRSLRAKYDKQSRKTSDGVKAIERLELLSQKIEDSDYSRILIGAILFYSEDKRYASLGDVLSLGPHNFPNFIPEKQKLVCLEHFFQYANTHGISLNGVESKESLIENNKLAIKPAIDTISQRFKRDIDDLFRKTRIVTVEGQIAKLPEEYKKEKSAHPSSYLSTFRAFDYSRERQKYLQLTTILNTPTINLLLPPACTTALAQEHYKYIIRCGYLLYMMKLIKSQPSGANSQLLKLCGDALGTHHISEIPKAEQQIYISNFKDFIERARVEPKIIEALKAGGLGDEKSIDKLLSATISNINSNFEGIVIPIAKCCLIASATSLTQFVIGIQIAKLANVVWSAGYGKGLLPALMAEAGHLIGGPTGRTIATYAGTVYEEAFMPALYARGFGIGLGYATGMLFETESSQRAKTLRITQDFCVGLDKDINHVVIKEQEVWRQELQQEVDWIQSLTKFYPEMLTKLKVILDANTIMTLGEEKESKEVAKM